MTRFAGIVCMMLSAAAVCASLLFVAQAAIAQEFSFGIKAGLPLGALVSTSPGEHAATLRYTLGPTVELGSYHGLAFDTDLLYKHFTFDFSIPPTATGNIVSGRSKVTGNRWELPIILKYRIVRRRPQTFVEVGASFNRVAAIHGISVCSRTSSGQEFYCVGNQVFFELRHRSTKGVLLGGGLEMRLGPLRLAPEFRLTHWADRNFGVRDAPLRSNLTETEFLVGITF
jgi:hypothetical protein